MHAHMLNNLSGSASSAFLQSFRTGNIIADMVIAMLLPIAFRAILDGNARQHFSNALSAVFLFMKRGSATKECIRTITFIQNHRCGPQIFESRNELLQKALALYFTEVAQVEFKGKAQVALTALTDTRWHNERPDRYNPLANLRLTWLAPDGEWVEMDKKEKIFFRQYTNAMPQNDGGNSNSHSVQQLKEQVCYELRCAGPDANVRIDGLISTAVEWYSKELQSQRDESRYMYVMNCPERFSISSTDKDDDAHKYKRYRLSDHKKFDSLFFEEKDALLSVLSDFEEKRGKYGISGFPHKLGVLLHGPPGTGKTSLIKALAQRTNRSIINIPLAQIKTNSMLMDVMYDLKLKVEGVETPRLSFADVIFVIEDVDAASKVVLRRDQSDDGGGAIGAEIDALKTALASSFGARRSRLGAVSANAPAAERCDSQDDQGCAEGPNKPQTSMGDMMEGLFKPRPDELNLAGLLNVLDGVVDTPGRLLIMTSNHPQRLDPALIRPGRIDRLIHLGYLKAGPAAQMLEHYFGTVLSESQRRVLDAALTAAEGTSTSALTPAMLEQLCARYATVDELLASLAAKESSSSAPVEHAAGERGTKRAAANDSPDAAKMKTGVTAGASSRTTMKEDSDPLSSELTIKRQTSGG